MRLKILIDRQPLDLTQNSFGFLKLTFLFQFSFASQAVVGVTLFKREGNSAERRLLLQDILFSLRTHRSNRPH